MGSVLLIQMKREELLQFAQDAITGLKINSDIARSVMNQCFVGTFFIPSLQCEERARRAEFVNMSQLSFRNSYLLTKYL